MPDLIYPKSERKRVEDGPDIQRTLWVIGALAVGLYLFFAIVAIASA